MGEEVGDPCWEATLDDRPTMTSGPFAANVEYLHDLHDRDHIVGLRVYDPDHISDLRNMVDASSTDHAGLVERLLKLQEWLATSSGYLGPRARPYAEAAAEAATLIETLTRERDEAQKRATRWMRACMEAREGCNQRSEVIRKWIAKGEAAEREVESLRGRIAVLELRIRP
jgi:hypothetical protein